MKQFTLSGDEYMAYLSWELEHRKTCPHCKNPTANGGRLTFCFTPTGVGTGVVIKCGCGASVDVTDVSKW